jgi:murein L,D-transpeptidase YcbB/YkuD
MRLCFIIIISIILFSCDSKVVHEVKTIKIITPEQVQIEIEKELSSFLQNDSILIIDSIQLNTYSFFKKNYLKHLIWFNQSQLNSKGDSLIEIIKNCKYYGLISEEYNYSKIYNEISGINKQKDSVNISSLVKADLLMSDAYYLMGANLNKGRLYPDSLLLQVDFKKLSIGWDSILLNGINNTKIKAALDSLEPKHYNYRMLKKELAIILNDKNYFNFDSIPFISETDSLKKISLIKKNLTIQGFYDTLSSASDSVKLAKAINGFQKKWFIQPDGKLGKYTKQALSYNRDKIIKQISMSMERWRWEESKFPIKYAFINIPAFWLVGFENDTVVMQSAVVCGKPETQTPILKSKIDHLLIYPYWNAPQSIATKEILPAVQRDISYLEKKHFEVIGKNNEVLDYTKLPWKKYSRNYLPVRFRQRIGEENSLGILKFNFYNPYGVYLHDTNSKRYFKTSSRAQSHGCIRLEQFSQLADFLIRDDSLHYTHDSLQQYFSIQQQRKINLKNRLPIYTRYYTAHADSTGLKLYLDIYRKDEELMKLLYK